MGPLLLAQLLLQLILPWTIGLAHTPSSYRSSQIYPRCNTTKTRMQHHKQRHKEGMMCFFWNCETHGGGRYARKDDGSHQHWINVSNHLSEVPCGQRANKCILGSEIHTTLDLVRQFYPPIIIGCISIFRVCDGRILISHIQIHAFPNHYNFKPYFLYC